MSTKPTFRKSNLGSQHPAAPAQAPAAAEPAAAQTPPTDPRPASTQPRTPRKTATTKQQRWEVPEGMMRLGIYMHAPLYNDAKSAYVASQDLDVDPARTIAEWIGNAIDKYNRLSAGDRAKIAQTLDPEERTGSANNRTFVVSGEIIREAQEAIAAGRRETNRVQSRSEYATEAIRWAIEQTRTSNGGQLPPAPARLPNGGKPNA